MPELAALTAPLITLAILLSLTSAILAAIDAALTVISAARVDSLVRSGKTASPQLATLIQHRPTYVNITIFLYMLTTIATVVVATALVVNHSRFTPWWLLATTIALGTGLFVIVGVGARTLGRQHAYTVGLLSAWPLTAAGYIFGPITRLLVLLGNALTPGKGFDWGPWASELEIRELVEMASQHGVVDAEEQRMIQSVFDLDTTTARAVMTPRTEMVWIESTKTLFQAIRLAIKSGHSRIPVIGENVDDVLGVVYLREMVSLAIEHDDMGRRTKVSSIMSDAQFVPDLKRIDDLLEDMQRNRNHLAILVDEYGAIAGLVSMEDIIEEIVGEIADETDTTDDQPIVETDTGYRVSARLPLVDLAEFFGLEFQDDILTEVDTVGGLLALQLGRVPLPGATITTHGLTMFAQGGPDGRGRVRVTTVAIQPANPEDTQND